MRGNLSQFQLLRQLEGSVGAGCPVHVSPCHAAMQEPGAGVEEDSRISQRLPQKRLQEQHSTLCHQWPGKILGNLTSRGCRGSQEGWGEAQASEQEQDGDQEDAGELGESGVAGDQELSCEVKAGSEYHWH